MVDEVAAKLMKELELDEASAKAFVECGFSSVEEIAYVPWNEMQEVALPEADLQHYRERARETLILAAEDWSKGMQDAAKVFKSMYPPGTTGHNPDDDDLAASSMVTHTGPKHPLPGGSHAEPEK